MVEFTIGPLAIKQRLDNDQSRGQFLLTGSANILTLPTVADALPGRVEYLNLWPLSQGELHDRHETFVDELFDGGFPQVSGAPVGRRAVATMLATGGYPELQGRSARGRSRFSASYVASMIGRDLEDIANVRDAGNVERLLFMIAARSGGLASFHGMATDLGINTNTVRAHTKTLEDLFLVRQLRPWHTNLGSRQIKSPSSTSSTADYWHTSSAPMSNASPTTATSPGHCWRASPRWSCCAKPTGPRSRRRPPHRSRHASVRRSPCGRADQRPVELRVARCVEALNRVFDAYSDTITT